MQGITFSKILKTSVWILYHCVNEQLYYTFLFVRPSYILFCSYQMKRIITVRLFLDSLSTFLPIKAKRTECCVSGTPTTSDQQYLILSTSHVLTPGDTSSTTTIELTNRSLMGILRMLTMTSVKWKYMVRHSL